MTWSSDAGSVASVSNAAGSRGLATSLAVGTATVSAALDGISGSTTLAVTDAVLVSLEVSPDGSAIASGAWLAFSALGVYSDGSRHDLTGDATWSSSDESVVRISNAADSRGLSRGVGVGAATISAAFEGQSASAALDVTDAVLVSIDVAPFASSLANGTELQFVAIGTYSDESSVDLTTQAAWSTSNGTIAVVSNADGTRGVVTGLGVGSAVVTATFGGISGVADLSVTSAVLVSISVEPANPSVQAGSTHAFTATGTFSDASTQDLTDEVTWSSSAPAVATVSNAEGSRGLATGLSGGTATIFARLDGQSGSTTMNVTVLTLLSIDVESPGVFLPRGYSMRLEATGHYSDGSSVDITRSAVWTSSATTIATVSNAAGTEGRVTGVAPGTANLTATLAGVSNLVQVTITNESLVEITVDPDDVTMDVGETHRLTAWGAFSLGTILDVTSHVRWSSNSKFDVSVNNTSAKGLVTAKRSGSAVIKAKKGNRQGTGDVTVN